MFVPPVNLASAKEFVRAFVYLDIFLPAPEDLLVNIRENKEVE